MTNLRYVILHHTGVAEPHYDILFESAGESLLTTFRCPHWPPRVGDVLEELADHRRAYLEYEGPISGDRGRVMRVDEGALQTTDLTTDPPVFAVVLTSTRSDRVEFSLTHIFRKNDDRATLWHVSTVINRA